MSLCGLNGCCAISAKARYNLVSMRTLSSSIMAALVVVALFWGNCFSCPEAVLALATHQPAHPCCHKSKASVPNCDTQNLQHFVKSSVATPAPAMPVMALLPQTAPAVSRDSRPRATFEYLQPDLLSVLSTYRV